MGSVTEDLHKQMGTADSQLRKQREKKRLSTVAHAIISALEKLRQEDYSESKATKPWLHNEF